MKGCKGNYRNVVAVSSFSVDTLAMHAGELATTLHILGVTTVLPAAQIFEALWLLLDVF
jgi:hypothetical protein